jgi:hypothetical protein
MEIQKKSKDILNKKCNFQVKITPKMEQEIESLSRLVCTPENEQTHADLKRQLLSNGLCLAHSKLNKEDFFKCDNDDENHVLPQPNEVTKRLNEIEKKVNRLNSNLCEMNKLLRAINDKPSLANLWRAIIK